MSNNISDTEEVILSTLQVLCNAIAEQSSQNGHYKGRLRQESHMLNLYLSGYPKDVARKRSAL